MKFCLLSRLLILLSALMISLPSLAISPKITIGEDYMMLMKSDGTVWTWGYNSGGSLGIGSNDTKTSPTQVPGLTNVVDVVVDRTGSFSMALKADGTVWVWGNLSGSRLGQITSGGEFRNFPVQITPLHQIVSLGTSGDAAFAVDLNGAVWSWGTDGYGELGDGGKTPVRGAPAQIANLTNVSRVSATPSQVVALKTDGTSVGWGDYYKNGDNLRLGLSADAYVLPTTMNVSSLRYLEAVDSNTAGLFMGVDAAGGILSWGDTNSGLLNCHQDIGTKSLSSMPQPYQVGGLSNIRQIAGGTGFVLFLDGSGAVKSCGDNGYGQLGDGTTASTSGSSTPPKRGPISTSGLPSDISYVAAGHYSSAAISSTGNVYTWGRGDKGLSGVPGTALSITAPVKVGIAAGDYANAPATFSGTQTGLISNVTIDAGVAVAPAHIGQSGQIYLAVVLPDKNNTILLLNNSGNFVPYDPAKPVPPIYTGLLPKMYPLNLIRDANLSSYLGTEFIVGYGLGSGSAADSDMLNSNRLSSVLRLK